MSTFRSLRHPGDVPAVLVYARRLPQPLLVCATPVMLLALVAMLEQYDPIQLAMWGLVGAYVVASGWTYLALQRTPAEVQTTGEHAAFRSVWDVALGRAPQWKRVIGVKPTDTGLTTTLGHDTYDLRREHWPDLPDVRHALEAALLAYETAVATASARPVRGAALLRRRARRAFGRNGDG